MASPPPLPPPSGSPFLPPEPPISITTPSPLLPPNKSPLSFLFTTPLLLSSESPATLIRSAAHSFLPIRHFTPPPNATSRSGASPPPNTASRPGASPPPNAAPSLAVPPTKPTLTPTAGLSSSSPPPLLPRPVGVSLLPSILHPPSVRPEEIVVDLSGLMGFSASKTLFVSA